MALAPLVRVTTKMETIYDEGQAGVLELWVTIEMRCHELSQVTAVVVQDIPDAVVRGTQLGHKPSSLSEAFPAKKFFRHDDQACSIAGHQPASRPAVDASTHLAGSTGNVVSSCNGVIVLDSSPLLVGKQRV